MKMIFKKIIGFIKAKWYWMNKWYTPVTLRVHNINENNFKEGYGWECEDIMEVYEKVREIEEGEIKIEGRKVEYIDLLLATDEDLDVMMVVIYK